MFRASTQQPKTSGVCRRGRPNTTVRRMKSKARVRLFALSQPRRASAASVFGGYNVTNAILAAAARATRRREHSANPATSRKSRPAVFPRVCSTITAVIITCISLFFDSQNAVTMTVPVVRSARKRALINSNIIVTNRRPYADSFSSLPT